MNRMNQMAGAMFNLWIISMFFYHLMNRIKQMAVAMIIWFIWFIW